MAVTPNDVVPRGRTLAWIWLAFLLSGFFVFCGFLLDRAIALSDAPLVAIQYDRKSPHRLPYVAVCFNDENLAYADGFLIGNTQQGRCFNAGGTTNLPLGPKAALPEALSVNNNLSCEFDIFRSPILVQYDFPPDGKSAAEGQEVVQESLRSNCRIETFYFKNRVGDCASCLGFPLSDKATDQTSPTQSQIYMGLHHPLGGPSSSLVSVLSIPFTVYLIETEDVWRARANKLTFSEMDTYASFVLNLNTSARVVIQDQKRKTYRYTETQHFQNPIVKPLAINPYYYYRFITQTSDYFLLNITTSSLGVEVLQEQNPWLALVSSFGGAWTIIFLIFGIFFVVEEGKEPEPILTWTNKAWFYKQLSRIGAWFRCCRTTDKHLQHVDKELMLTAPM